jgi:hypothetical protein
VFLVSREEFVVEVKESGGWIVLRGLAKGSRV